MPKVKSKDGLTDKQRLSIKAYINPDSPTFLNKTKSVDRYYDTSSLNASSVIGADIITDENLVKLRESNPDLAIDPHLTSKLTKEWLVTKLLEMVDTKGGEINET